MAKGKVWRKSESLPLILADKLHSTQTNLGFPDLLNYEGKGEIIPSGQPVTFPAG